MHCNIGRTRSSCLGCSSLENGVLTACADNLIRYFASYKSSSRPTSIFKGHTQPVRSLAKISDDLFVSGANDGSIRIWSLSSGQLVRHLDGHESFVYSVDVLPSGELVSGGEDRSMRVWAAESGDLVQTITLPATSVWSVVALSSGDIAAGTSDGVVRVFSRDPNRQADATLQQEFEATISATALNSHQIGDIKKTDLPGPDALYVPGKKRRSNNDGEECRWFSRCSSVVCLFWLLDKDWNSCGCSNKW